MRYNLKKALFGGTPGTGKLAGVSRRLFMKRLVIYLGFTLIISSCAPRIVVDVSEKLTPLDNAVEVVVFGLTNEVPTDAKLLGTVKVGDSGLTADCDYATILAAAKFEARKIGGNVLKIVKHQTPDLKSTCHRITAKIYYLEDITNVTVDNLTEDAYFDSTANYALLYVYRVGGVGPLVSYTVHLGDIELCKVRYKTGETIMVTVDGPNELWAKTESKAAIPINIEFGREYYLRCEVTMGLFVGRPKLTLVDRATGKSEFDSIKKKNK